MTTTLALVACALCSSLHAPPACGGPEFQPGEGNPSAWAPTPEEATAIQEEEQRALEEELRASSGAAKGSVYVPSVDRWIEPDTTGRHFDAEAHAVDQLATALMIAVASHEGLGALEAGQVTAAFAVSAARELRAALRAPPPADAPPATTPADAG